MKEEEDKITKLKPRNNKEAVEMQLGINEVKIRSMEKIFNEYKIKANVLEDQIENIITLIESISKKDKRKYSSYFNKISDEQHKNTFKELVKNFRNQYLTNNDSNQKIFTTEKSGQSGRCHMNSQLGIVRSLMA